MDPECEASGGDGAHEFGWIKKEKGSMLKDLWGMLLELDNVSFSFSQLDKNFVANANIFYHLQGSRQALRVVFYLDSFHLSRLPSCLESRASLQLHTVLFTKDLDNVEGHPPPGSQVVEDMEQEINAQSLDKVQQYCCKLRAFYLERSNLPTDASTTVVKIDQLIQPINALNELCHIMQSLVHPRPSASGSPGTSLIPISSEICCLLGACQIAKCGTGMQLRTLSVSAEQVAILAWSHGLLPKCIMQATDIMCKQGHRVKILAKTLCIKDLMPWGSPSLYHLCQPPVDVPLAQPQPLQLPQGRGQRPATLTVDLAPTEPTALGHWHLGIPWPSLTAPGCPSPTMEMEDRTDEALPIEDGRRQRYQPLTEESEVSTLQNLGWPWLAWEVVATNPSGSRDSNSPSYSMTLWLQGTSDSVIDGDLLFDCWK
ncbi:phosphatidylinositol 3,4,5-trisphosphate-dependent Rac exchanger 1 protein-like [Dipodomys spectabilis]|uniref:phosphatidylinositol 3,4,5-trisphosphate-dependent Rac exchanger 1 protein-like n=1 Tax=Dipodomys spectabilis TaxID=105255 RepID=UPI001C53E0EB|nr:phosphatidylinositol 3,4,5-trisphosphate-dependent Rac exchanger 1 protein-like [Dipodomys spectabilis]